MMLDQSWSPAEEQGAPPRAAFEPAINRSEVRSHFAMLHPLAAPLQDKGKFVICGFGEETGEVVRNVQNKPRTLRPEIRHVYIDDVDASIDHVNYLGAREHYNVYVGLAVYRNDLPPRSRGTKKDIIGVIGLVADFDDADAARWAERLPLAPQLVLETSAGRFQAFFVFSEPERPELVEPIAKRLKEFAGCDHGQPRLAHWWDVEFPQREKDRRRSIARATTRPRRCAVGWHDSSAGGLGGGAVWSPRSPRNTARAARS
jgi:RepB DNA-primase from phage plasmid